MSNNNNLESLYTQARQALKAKEYDHASDLLRQILLIDENYKDASRLLAQSVKLKRRRWYNDPRSWGALGVAMIIALGFLIAPHMRGFYTVQSTTAVTDNPTIPISPTIIATATETPPTMPTPVPLTWKRVSIGQEFERDTVTALVIDPKDPEVLYVGMKNAGVYKSIDGGLAWRPAHQGLASAHVESLVIDFQNPQILYAGTLSGIFKTEDGGENWSKISEGKFLLIDPQDSSHLYARDDDEISESSDQGKNWKSVYTSEEGCPGKIYSWVIHPTNGKTLFMIGGEKCDWGVYTSTDGGQRWTLIPYYRFEIPSDANVFDYGVDKLAVGLYTQGNLDIHPYETAAYDSMGSVYTYWDTQLRKSRPDDDQTITLGRPDVETGENRVTVIAISPFDPNTIYVAGRGISVSKDGGLTWAKLNNGLAAMLVTLETGEGNSPTLYLQEECDNSNFPYLEQKYGYLDKNGRQEPGQPLFISKNGGQTWDLASETGCYLIKDADGVTLYRIARAIQYCNNCQKPDGWIWRSQDGGQTWRRAMSIHQYWNLVTLVAHPTESGTLFALNSGDEQFTSKDYGDSWERINSPLEYFPCYGETLRFINEYHPMAIDPRDGNHVFVIDNGILLESHNSCDTTSAFTTVPNTSMNSIAFDPNNSNTIYAGTDGGAYISFDSGNTWNQVNDGLLGATVVYSIAVDKDGNVYAATPYGVFKLEGE